MGYLMDNEKETIKEYKINESVLVTYHTLDSLYQNFFAMYPTEIGKKVENLINDLRDNIIFEPENDYKGYDIKEYFYSEKVIYKPSPIDNKD